MNKRELLLDLLDSDKPQSYIPAAFFIHFDKIYHKGRKAIDKHLEYFRYTGMDFVKIQYESLFPHIPGIEAPDDWEKFNLYQKEDFYKDQLDVVEGLVRAAKKEALVIMTLYSPFMCARATTSDEMITAHIKESPDKVGKAIEIITESLLLFVRACIRIGVDGFYMSSQGGENHRFEDPSLFRKCIKPYDLAVMEEVSRACIFNILHVCDFRGKYDDLSPFLDYPGHIVSFSQELGNRKINGKDVSRFFGRPFMGGLDRKGKIATGSSAEIREEVFEVLRDSPERFILGADCTLPDDVSWDNIRAAISAAHEYKA